MPPARCNHHTEVLAARAAPRLLWFDRVLADVGDGQSLQQSLSTFSGHVRRLRLILAAVTPASLALLDEVGSGTVRVCRAACCRAASGALLLLRRAFLSSVLLFETPRGALGPQLLSKHRVAGVCQVITGSSRSVAHCRARSQSAASGSEGCAADLPTVLVKRMAEQQNSLRTAKFVLL